MLVHGRWIAARPRANGMEWQMKTIRVVDVETTGTEPGAKVCEIASVEIIGEGSEWKRGPYWSALVNPGCAIPPEASGVHHITDEMVAGAKSLDEVLIEHLFVPPPCEAFAAHEARFERQFFPHAVQICTRKVAQFLFPESPNHKLQTLRYFLGLRFAEDFGPPHRALGDAMTAAALLAHCLRHVT